MICTRCKQDKPDNGTYKTCKDCRKWWKKYYEEHKEECQRRGLEGYYERRNYDPDKVRAQKRAWSRKNPVSYMLSNIKQRAKRKGINFSLIHEDIVIPDVCPVLGIQLFVGDGTSRGSSPSVDRCNPNEGYTKDSIRIISHRANTIKQDATIEEIEKVLHYMKTLSI